MADLPADAYLTFAQVDAVFACVSMGVALLIWRLLRPQTEKMPHGTPTVGTDDLKGVAP